MARSLDQGKTWEQWLVAGVNDGTAFFPYLVARGRSEVAATWFSRKLSEDAALDLHLAKIRIRDGDTPPQISASPPFQIDAVRGNTKSPQPGGEFVPVTLLRNRRLVVVTPIQNAPAKRFWVLVVDDRVSAVWQSRQPGPREPGRKPAAFAA